MILVMQQAQIGGLQACKTLVFERHERKQLEGHAFSNLIEAHLVQEGRLARPADSDNRRRLARELDWPAHVASRQVRQRLPRGVRK